MYRTNRIHCAVCWGVYIPSLTLTVGGLVVHPSPIYKYFDKLLQILLLPV